MESGENMQKEFFGDVSYRENPFNDDFAVYLFNEGNNYKSYEILGAHKCTLNGKAGYRFAVCKHTIFSF